jgi:hypothetical protein
MKSSSVDIFYSKILCYFVEGIMPELFRTRDVVVLFKGDSYTVSLDNQMLQSGWSGGQGVMWKDSPKDEFLVTYADGLYGGFLLWGSDESSDKFTGYIGQHLKYGYGVFCAGGWLMSTSTFERYTYASRVGPGPLVPITYTVGERLRFSLRGLFTNEDEWTLSGDPRAPNGFFIASVVQIPTNNSMGIPYITLQTSI